MDRARSIHKAVLCTSCSPGTPDSAQPWKGRRATILVAAAKCANIDSAIPCQAPPAITGNKMTPRGMRKNRAPRNLDSRLLYASSGSTRRDRDELDTGSAPIPARGVVASPSPRRSRAPSPRRDLQPAARDDPSRRSPSGAPSARRPPPDRLPRAVRSPDLSAARSLAGRARRPSRTRATALSRGLVPGWAGRNAAHSAHSVIRLDSGMPCLACGRRSNSGRKPVRTRRVLLSR
jgi:hypothetical protein